MATATFHPPTTSAFTALAFTILSDLCYSAANKPLQEVCQLCFSVARLTDAL